MPVGTGAETLQTIPTQPFVIDPGAFFQMTRKNILQARSLPAPGPGVSVGSQLLQTGVVSKLQITFTGTLVVATAAVTSGMEWPYNLLKGFTLSANGQNELFSCDGVDLHALRFLRYPAYIERVDQFPGTVGGGDSIAVGTYNVHLTWEVPIAMDDTSLVGSLYAQSAATNLSIRLAQATNADLFSANPANATLSGTFLIQETYFEIPFDGEGNIVIPDLTRLHGFVAQTFPLTNTGDVRTELIRSAGQLSRLLVSAHGSPTNRLSALPNAVATKKIDRLRLEYGGNQRPFVWDPAATLLSLNGQHYGAPLPYDRLCVDLVRENPVRDLILMQGITELAAVLGIGGSVVPSNGTIRLVQENLF